MADSKTALVISSASAVAGAVAEAAIEAYAPGSTIEAALAGKTIEVVGGVLASLAMGGDKVAAAIRNEQLADLVSEAVAHRLDENLRRLVAQGQNPRASDVAAVFADFSRCWMGADPQKRRLLKYAFINAFDPDLYQSGLLTLAFSKVNELCYGDLVLLSVLVDEERFLGDAPDHSKLEAAYRSRQDRTKGDFSAYVPDSPLQKFHLGRLIDHDLVARSERSYAISLGRNEATSVARHVPTVFGRRVAQMVAEGLLTEDLEGSPINSEAP